MAHLNDEVIVDQPNLSTKCVPQYLFTHSVILSLAGVEEEIYHKDKSVSRVSLNIETQFHYDCIDMHEVPCGGYFCDDVCKKCQASVEEGTEASSDIIQFLRTCTI